MTAIEQYIPAFRSRNPYTDHDVARGPYRLAARRFEASGPVSGPPVILLNGYPVFLPVLAEQSLAMRPVAADSR